MKKPNASPATAKLVLVGKHRVYRAALACLIEAESSLRVVGDVADLAEVHDVVRQHGADVVFIDMDRQRVTDAELHQLQITIDRLAPLRVVVGCDGVEAVSDKHRLTIAARATVVEKSTGWPAVLQALNRACNFLPQRSKQASDGSEA